MKWNPSLYDEKHGFVAEYGKSLLELIPQNPDQTILDLGCGTGALTRQLLPLASRVAGADSSPDMIRQAQAQNPVIEFLVCDALDLLFREEWDVVFSNAVFHWIGDHDSLLESIRRALKPQGLLVCEFGARGNIGAVEAGFSQAAAELGYAYRPKFNFPSPEDFRRRLETHGFLPQEVYAYDRSEGRGAGPEKLDGPVLRLGAGRHPSGPAPGPLPPGGGAGPARPVEREGMGGRLPPPAGGGPERGINPFKRKSCALQHAQGFACPAGPHFSGEMGERAPKGERFSLFGNPLSGLCGPGGGAV